MKLSIPLTLRWELMLSHNESEPRLDAWVTQNVSRQFVSVPLSKAKGETGITVTLDTHNSGSTPDPAQSALKAAIAAASLSFAATAVVDNGHGERCEIPAGNASVSLAALSQKKEIRAYLRFPMIADEEGGVKGVLVMRLDDAITFDGRDLASQGITLVRAARHGDRSLEAYIERAEQRYSPLSTVSTWSSLDNINMFRYVSSVGVLPAAAYLRVPAAPTTEHFFLNAARLALRRMRAPEEAALAWRAGADATDSRRAAYWLAHTLQLYDQYCDYVEDFVWAPVPHGGGTVQFRRTPIEWFQFVRTRRGAGDCEDLASETAVLARELTQLRTSAPLLVKLKEVLAAYYVVLLLDGVSAVEINLTAKKGGDGARHQEAHMNSALLSRHHVHTWLRSDGKRRTGGSAAYPPIVMMEGTGPLDPNGVEHARADAVAEELREQVVNSLGPLDKCARQIFHYDSTGKCQSQFYKTIKLVGSAFIDEHCFIWLLSPTHSSRATIGVSFQQVAAADPNVTMRCEQPFSDAQLRVMDEALLDRHPVPPLDGPDEAAAAPEVVANARQQMADVLRQTSELLKGASPNIAQPGRIAPQPAHTSVVMLKYAHFDRQGVLAGALVKSVRCATQDRTAPLIAFEAQEERVTADRGGWRILYTWPDRSRVVPRTESIVDRIAHLF